jgi:hypothetical protein
MDLPLDGLSAGSAYLGGKLTGTRASATNGSFNPTPSGSVYEGLARPTFTSGITKIGGIPMQRIVGPMGLNLWQDDTPEVAIDMPTFVAMTSREEDDFATAEAGTTGGLPATQTEFETALDGYTPSGLINWNPAQTSSHEWDVRDMANVMRMFMSANPPTYDELRYIYPAIIRQLPEVAA